MTIVSRAASVQLDRIRKSYGSVPVIHDLSLEMPSGSLLTLLGPSGCGKSTLLRMIAGFVNPDTGDIRIGGNSVRALPPEARPSAMVFQNYALFPHMSIAANVAFGPTIRRLERTEVESRVSEALALVKVDHLANRYPHELSGGQQQRVALARCLAVQPQVLLLDEPFGALDRGLREEMQVEMRKLQQRLGITMIVVTHDQDEALALSDSIAVMNSGRIEQLGTPGEVYDHPATRFTASFMGVSNILPGQIGTAERDKFELSNGLQVQLKDNSHTIGPGVLALRPENLKISQKSSGGAHQLAGKVAFATMLGHKVKYEVDIGGVLLSVVTQRQENMLPQGSDAYVEIDPQHAMVYTS